MLAGRSRSLSPDTEGKYRPYLGFTWVDGERKPKRWNLGRNKWEAERRFQRLRVLYDEDCDKGPVKGCWTTRGLQIGEQIASGVEALRAAPPAPDDPRAVIE